MEQPKPDARRSPRRRVYKGAQISFYGLGAPIDCAIRDISETGARLTVGQSAGIPEIIDLLVPGERLQRCRVVWRNATQIGVAFVAETGSMGARR
jgi:hypothetical protein